MPVVLYDCESWSLTQREEHKKRVSENRVFRRIFGYTKDKLTGEWRKLYNDDLDDLQRAQDIFRVKKIEKNEMGGACSTNGREERCIQGFGWEP